MNAAKVESRFQMNVLSPFGVKVISWYQGQPLDELDCSALTSLVQTHKLVLLRGFAKQSRDSFLNYSRDQLGRFLGKTTLDWEFGSVMEMKEMPDPKNYLFSRERVPFHWDGAFHRVPDYLMFYCVDAPTQGAGGQTLFCQTQKIWQDASPEDQALWSRIELTYETAKLAHYGGKIKGPLVQGYPKKVGQGDNELPILRFAEAVTTQMNPVTMQVNGVSPSERDYFLKDFIHRIYSPRYCYQQAWEPGDILIADNHALIHGREAFTQDCPRHLRRIQLISQID